MSFVSVLRLASGLAMVAGGVILCTPLARDLVSAVGHQPSPGGGPMPAPMNAASDPVEATERTLPQGIGGDGLPGLPDAAALPAAAWPPEDDFVARSVYSPPVPPPALAAPAPAAAVPEVEPHYRSMLDVPPPALLDAQRPPPVTVSWSAQPRPAPRSLPDALVPASVVVREGDDLESIATRYYGHPAAAAAIWGANREHVPDPRLLPIGLELRLPPPWTIVPAGADAAIGGAPAVEPTARGLVPPAQAALPAGAMPSGSGPLGAGPDPWLSQPPAAQPAGPPTAAAQPARPTVVRVGRGETMASIAKRFYGDESVADRIWQANRDRLRSPRLLVPGMELRLP